MDTMKTGKSTEYCLKDGTTDKSNATTQTTTETTQTNLTNFPKTKLKKNTIFRKVGPPPNWKNTLMKTTKGKVQ